MSYSLQPFNREDRLPILPGMGMDEFMKRTSTYEDQPVPLSPRLRIGAWVGMALTLVSTLILFTLSYYMGAISGLGNLPFMFLGGQFHGYLMWISHNNLIAYIDGVLFGSGLVLLLFTRNLRRGKLTYHWLAFAQAIGGSLNLMIFVIPLLILLFYAIILIAMLLLAILVIAAIVGLVVLLS